MCSPDRLQLVGEVLAAGRRGVEVALDHHGETATNDTVTMLTLHGSGHTGDTLVRNLQAWDGFAESAIDVGVE